MNLDFMPTQLPNLLVVSLFTLVQEEDVKFFKDYSLDINLNQPWSEIYDDIFGEKLSLDKTSSSMRTSMEDDYRGDQSQYIDYLKELPGRVYFGNSAYSGYSDYIDSSTTVFNPKDPGVPVKQCFLRCLGQKNVDQIVACEYAPQAVDFRHQGRPIVNC